MKLKRNLLLVIVLAVALALSLVPALTLAAATDDELGTEREYVVSKILSAGMNPTTLGTADDRDALAKSLGFLADWNYNPTATVTPEIAAEMDLAMNSAYIGLRNALAKDPPEPYFVNGLAQPIFPYGNSTYNDTSGDGIARYVVYVETNYDTDADGKLDLVKVLVQLPRAAVTKGMKLSTIYEARPYIEGTNGSVHVNSALTPLGNAWLTANGPFTHEKLHGTAPPRIPTGETDTKTMVENANYRDWLYRYTYNQSGFSAAIAYGTGGDNCYENLGWYDYFLVRGFAFVTSAGLAAAASDGLSTYGADIEIDAYKCVIEWLTGDRKAYSDRTSNIEVKADWSNGIVGMTGRSYAGTTPFGIATSGVKGLKTIVPVAGIASYYEYQNQQGRMSGAANYTPGMAWYINSRLASPDWSTVVNRQAGYIQQMLQEATALSGNYGEHWARRDYTLENWYLDWGPSKIQTPMLIVHGANDDNVRPKQSVLMYQAAKKAGVDVRLLWHQGHHMTPTFPKANPTATDPDRPFSMYCGDYLYDEWLNLWFSHYLYDEDNHILELLPGVLAQDNGGEWKSYDSWDPATKIILDNKNRSGGASDFTTINSANGTSTWANLINAPTAASTLYVLDLPEDITVNGVVQINFRAAIQSLGSSAGKPLGVHAKLVEIAAPGTTLKYYGGNAMGSTIAVDRIKTGGSWQGGGIASQNLVQFRQATTGTYREIAKGWMDLCNPEAGYESRTAANSINPRNNIGVYHDYSLYLLPAIHTAKKGNKLALFLTTGATGTAAYTGNNAFTFSIDNAVTNTVIPVEFAKPQKPLSIEVADVWGKPGGAVDVTYKISGNELGFSTLDLAVPYNNSIYTPIAVKPAGDLNSPLFVVNPNYKTDLMKIAFAARENVSGDGLLFTVTYQIAAGHPGIGSYPLDLEVIKIQYANFMDAMIDLEAQVLAGSLTLGLLGDINDDGVITPEDAIMLLQMYVGLIPWTNRALLLGDVNGDGVIDSTDAALILRMVVGG